MLVAVILCTICQLAPPLAVSPARPTAGDIIELDASAIDPKAKFFAWTATPKLDSPRKTIQPNGPKATLCSVPGVYRVVVAIADDKGIRLIEHDVTVAKDSDPAPSPQPTPTPPGPAPGPPMPHPQPPGPAPLPPGRFELAGFVHALANALPADAKARAPALAAAFRGLSSAIAAGGLSAWQVPTETTKAFDAAVAPHKTAWQPISKATQIKLRELQKAGKLAALSDLADAYTEIALGLEAVR